MGVFALNKKVIYTLSTAFLLSGLTGCAVDNNDEGAAGNNNNNTNATRPIGYYSDENVNRNDRNGNAILPERDNDGPVTEMLDRTTDGRTNGRGAGNIGTRDDGIVGEDHDRMGARNVGTNNNRGMNGHTGNNENTALGGDNRFSGNDYNYHGQMMGQNNNEKASYKNNYNGELAQKISNRVKDMNNVDDARTIVN